MRLSSGLRPVFLPERMISAPLSAMAACSRITASSYSGAGRRVADGELGVDFVTRQIEHLGHRETPHVEQRRFGYRLRFDIVRWELASCVEPADADECVNGWCGAQRASVCPLYRYCNKLSSPCLQALIAAGLAHCLPIPSSIPCALRCSRWKTSKNRSSSRGAGGCRFCDVPKVPRRRRASRWC